jgi:hypothetical protein
VSRDQAANPSAPDFGQNASAAASPSRVPDDPGRDQSTRASESLWPSGVLDITFDDIKFAMEKHESFERALLTERIEQLQGRDVKIRGYILPSFRQHGITQFVLVRDNMECCFGPGAALYDCILVHMAKGTSISYTVRPVVVEGRFAIEELTGPDGEHLAIYRLSGRAVK